MNILQLDPNEEIVLEVRKHWFVFFAQGFLSFVIALAPFFLYESIISFINNKVSISSDVTSLFWFLYSLWLLFVWIGFFFQWTNYYFDVWYITGKRIIDVEQKGMFHRQVSSLRFDKIQDISVEVKGIIPHFFHFGDVKVQTAAEDSSGFSIKNAAHPERIRQVVFARHNREAEKTMPVTIINDGKPQS